MSLCDPQEQNKEKNTGGNAEEAEALPMMVETIFTVPRDIWNLILSSLDPFEVANLRCSCRDLRQVLNGEDFVRRFNSRHQLGPTWTYIHVQTSEGPGSLVGFRWSDQTAMRTDLQGIVHSGDIIQKDILTLLCSARSFLLFSRIRAGEEPVLIVVNLVNRSSVVISCPPPMNNFRFAWRREDIKLVVPDIENDLQFEIIACILGRPRRLPIMCVYSSMVNDWLVLQEAEEYSNSGLIQENDHRSMFLVNLPFGDAYYISMQKESPIFIQKLFQPLFTRVMTFKKELLDTEDGWFMRISRHFTNQGWAAAMFTHVNPDDDRHIIIHDLKLYRMTPQLDVYEQKAVLDPDHLEPPLEVLVMPGAITLEATHEMVQLGMVVSVGPGLWCMKYFIFNIASGNWSFSNPPPFSALRIGGPVLTSGLTL